MYDLQFKFHRLSFIFTEHQTFSPLQLIHSDAVNLLFLLIVDTRIMFYLLMTTPILHGFVS